jgi:hypothetical protein
MKPGEIFILMSTVLLAIIMSIFFAWELIIWSLIVICTMVLLGLPGIFQKKHIIKKYE